MTRPPMRIHGICVAKDEADIIGQTLERAVAWCDRIHVLDNGSSDRTMEVVEELAGSHPDVFTIDRDPRPFDRAMRGVILDRYRPEARPGDWWCTLDADEIYIDDPQAFLSAVPDRFGNVYSASFQYYFTDEDLGRFEEDPSRYADDVPVEQKIRYYINNWSELRFYRDTTSLRWSGERPVKVGATYPERIRLKHYQYRSPQQIERRVHARFAATGAFDHERRPGWRASLLLPARDRVADQVGSPPTWETRIMRAADLYRDDGDGVYDLRPDLMPDLPSGPPSGICRIRRRVMHALRRL